MLLDEIIALATDDKQSITVLLRKCVVLAHHLKNERLRVWANDELNGYASAKELPEYRHMSAGATGTFVGPGWIRFQRGIPSGMLKQEHKEWAKSVHICQSIKSLEHLLESPTNTVFFPWDQNLVVLYQHDLLDGYTLMSANQTVPKAAIAGILDTVRNRVLNMALEVKSEIGETDADLERMAPQEAKKVDQSVVNNIFGGNVYVSTGESTMNAATIQHQQQNIVAGDWEHLTRVLHSAGMSEADVTELSEAVDRDGKTLGNTVTGWIKKNAPKALSGGVKIGAAVGQNLLVEYLKQYLGLT
jgi:hypothetical protein